MTVTPRTVVLVMPSHIADSLPANPSREAVAAAFNAGGVFRTINGGEPFERRMAYRLGIREVIVRTPRCPADQRIAVRSLVFQIGPTGAMIELDHYIHDREEGA